MEKYMVIGIGENRQVGYWADSCSGPFSQEEADAFIKAYKDRFAKESRDVQEFRNSMFKVKLSDNSDSKDAIKLAEVEIQNAYKALKSFYASHS